MVMKQLWIVFKHNGNELLRCTVKGLHSGEMENTKNLLAYEKHINAEEIEVTYDFN